LVISFRVSPLSASPKAGGSGLLRISRISASAASIHRSRAATDRGGSSLDSSSDRQNRTFSLSLLAFSSASFFLVCRFSHAGVFGQSTVFGVIPWSASAARIADLPSLVAHGAPPSVGSPYLTSSSQDRLTASPQFLYAGFSLFDVDSEPVGRDARDPRGDTLLTLRVRVQRTLLQQRPSHGFGSQHVAFEVFDEPRVVDWDASEPRP